MKLNKGDLFSKEYEDGQKAIMEVLDISPSGKHVKILMLFEYDNWTGTAEWISIKHNILIDFNKWKRIKKGDNHA